MAYVMTKNLSARGNYGGQRDLKDIKYIALHYTANDGDSDEGNANYFHNHIVKASAHYFVDDDSITQSVPDDYVAWSVGGKLYTDHVSTGGGRLYGIATNNNTLNIEMCDTVKDGVIRASEATIGNAIDLICRKMKQYDIDIDHVIRHFDVNGKHCPAYLMDESKWKKFKARILGYELGRAYRMTKACYLRMTPAGQKVAYRDLPKSMLKKCRNAKGYAMIRYGKTFVLADFETVGSGLWGRTQSGYWLQLKSVKVK